MTFSKPWNLTTCLSAYATLLVLTAQFAGAQTLTTASGAGRRLAPDALVEIPPGADYGDTFQGPIDLPVSDTAGLKWQPNYAPESETLAKMAENVVFRGDAYSLGFAFKPVRMVKVNGNTVWYLLYRVRYVGGDLQPKPEQDPYNNEVFAQPASVNAQWVRFLPEFSLDVRKPEKHYLDQIVPGAREVIAAKERVGKPIYNSVEMQRLKIKLSTEAEDNSVWGVAMWRGVDPATDFFSVEVTGLTNAQRLKQDGEKIEYLPKRLVLHFTRPGDTLDELEDRIRYGIPAIQDEARQKYVLDQFGVEERLDYMWVYR